MWLRTFGGFSITRDNAAPEQIRVYRKAHAVLAVLAVQGSTGRERLMALLWPESDSERARGSLKQTLHLLRRELDAPDLLLGTAELRLNPERIESDVGHFARALAAGDFAKAVQHYGGLFLDGVHVEGTPEFERWLDMQRVELSRQYMGALEELARAAEAQGNYSAAASWWRRLQNADPANSRVAVNLMLALEASGDRAAALRHAGEHETLLREEWEITPDPGVVALADRLRSPAPALSRDPAPAPRAALRTRDPLVHTPAIDAGETSASAVALPHAGQTARAPRQSVSRPVVAAVVAAMLLLAVAYAVIVVDGSEHRPVVAIGELDEHGSGTTDGVAAAAGDMLATNLARVPGLHVVSSARMYEILAQLDTGSDRRAAIAEAARRAGAAELLEGALTHTRDGWLRLDLRRVDLRTGAVRAAYTIEAADAFQVVDRATIELAAGFGLTTGDLRLADATTQSLVAYRFYEEGLRSFTVGDYRAAERLFAAAFAEDSLFAMAAHFLWATRGPGLHGTVPETARARLLRLADRAADRERLLIRASWGDPLAPSRPFAAAESLANRYPNEPDGQLLLASHRHQSGDFAGALPYLRRVIGMDSLGLRGTQPRCRACDAFSLIILAYTNADSLTAAERTAREWVRQQPRSARAWAALAQALEAQDRSDDALAARRTAATLNPIDYHDELFPAALRIRMGDFATADGILRDLARDGTPELQREALWWLTISLRYQGRLREALTTIRQLTHDTATQAVFPALLHEGHVLFELGRFADAARRYHDAAHLPPARDALTNNARLKSWALTQHASALAAAADTARLAALADTIETWGRRSTFGRDWRLHHHVRGLLLTARGQPESAVAEFRRAIFSPTSGYTRTNLELARLLLGLGRSHDAVSILQPAFRGPLEGSSLSVTRPELHELLGRAWEAAGRPDSAAVHYQGVLDAWRHADPELHARRDSVTARMAQRRI